MVAVIQSIAVFTQRSRFPFLPSQTGPKLLRCTAPAYLNVSQGAPQDTEVGGLLFVHVWNVPFQGLKALFKMGSSGIKTAS